MTLTASFSIIRCPACGDSLMASGIQISNEPGLDVVTCQNCQAEIQISEDPMTGKMTVERVKKN